MTMTRSMTLTHAQKKKKITFDEGRNKVNYIYYTGDGEKPNPEHSNVLEGKLARNAAKVQQIGNDWQLTHDILFREFKQPVDKGGCGSNWDLLEERLGKVEDPYFSIIGQFWRMLYGEAPRNEELRMQCRKI